MRALTTSGKILPFIDPRTSWNRKDNIIGRYARLVVEFKALSRTTRGLYVEMLCAADFQADGTLIFEQSITDLAKSCELTRAKIYPHLKKLIRAGYVEDLGGDFGTKGKIARFAMHEPTRPEMYPKGNNSELPKTIPEFAQMYPKGNNSETQDVPKGNNSEPAPIRNAREDFKTEEKKEEKIQEEVLGMLEEKDGCEPERLNDDEPLETPWDDDDEEIAFEAGEATCDPYFGGPCKHEKPIIDYYNEKFGLGLTTSHKNIYHFAHKYTFEEAAMVIDDASEKLKGTADYRSYLSSILSPGTSENKVGLLRKAQQEKSAPASNPGEECPNTPSKKHLTMVERDHKGDRWVCKKCGHKLAYLTEEEADHYYASLRAN